MEESVKVIVIVEVKDRVEDRFAPKTPMKIIFKYLHHVPSPSLTAWIEQQLGELGKTRQIDEARVVINVNSKRVRLLR